jgi:hypothetical protein
MYLSNSIVQSEALEWLRPKDSRGLYCFPERSNQKKSDQGNNITGSAFAQLGYLYYTPEDEWDKDIDPEDHEWRNSGYTVVAMINDDGKLGEVWIIYNFTPYNEAEGGTARYRVSQKACWGWLQDAHQRRSGARIARGIEELGPNAQ